MLLICLQNFNSWSLRDEISVLPLCILILLLRLKHFNVYCVVMEYTCIWQIILFHNWLLHATRLHVHMTHFTGHFHLVCLHDAIVIHEILCSAPWFNLCPSRYVPGCSSTGTRGISGYHRRGQELPVKVRGCYQMSTDQWLSRHIVLRKRDWELLSGCHLPIGTRQTESCICTSWIILRFHWHLQHR